MKNVNYSDLNGNLAFICGIEIDEQSCHSCKIVEQLRMQVVGRKFPIGMMGNEGEFYVNRMEHSRLLEVDNLFQEENIAIFQTLGSRADLQRRE